MQEITMLDRILFGSSDMPDADSVVDAIVEGQLWPGLRDPDAVATYLRGVSGEAADLVAASLLVLLHRDAAILDDVSWRPVAAELLAGKLDQLRPHAEKPHEKGSHAVFTACAGVVDSVQSDFKSQCSGLSDLRQIGTLQNAVFRRLNGGAGSVLLRPFVPRAEIDGSLSKLFDAARSMAEAEPSDRDAAYAALSTAISECEQAVSAANTHFARHTAGEVVSAVSAVATRSIELSRPPAEIVATVDLRPLPLRESGVTCDVSVHLENPSDVAATGITVTCHVPHDDALVPSEPILVGTLKPRTGAPLSIPVTVVGPQDLLDLTLEVTWRNPDHSTGLARYDAHVPAQACEIDWDSVASLQPFAPYPVEDAEDLVGRAHLLRQLELQFATAPLGNLYVTGQRRVGKTSLVRVLTQQLTGNNDRLLVAAVEMGEVRQEGGTETITQLGASLARKLIRRAGATGVVEPPAFEGSLAPLNGLIDELRELDDRLRFLLVIDEFDELPDPMFRRGGPGDAMFLPMRSLAQKPHVGWLLVGGERMPYIRDEQATRLNTFTELKVDYLPFVERDARTDAGSGNFASLVRGPLPEGFTVGDDAVAHVHAMTQGNPHFAKAVCAEVYTDAVQRKDAVIDQRDVERAVSAIAARNDLELFAHFWEDGIFSNDVDERRRVELERRHLLAAVAECRRSGRSEPDRVEAAAERLGVTKATARRTRQDFVRRGVLAEKDSMVTAKVPLFDAWLEDEGAYQLTPKGIAERTEGEIQAADAAAQVSPSEITRLLRQWRGFKYRGESITRDDVVQWLDQFDNAVEQRLMFRLLERFRLITEAELLEGLRRLNRLIGHEGRISLDRGQRTLAHVVVAGVGGPGTSGEAIAYKYRQANNVRQRNVVGVDQIGARLAEDPAVRSVVLVDDFIGSGKTVTKSLATIGSVDRTDVQFYVFAVSGIPEAVVQIERDDAAAQLGVRVELAHALNSSQRPFTADSAVFKTESDQMKAEEVVRRHGTKLLKAMPLGFHGQSALITFPDNCPNNAPPIFWSDANGWRPLFSRTAR